MALSANLILETLSLVARSQVTNDLAKSSFLTLFKIETTFFKI